MAGGQMAELTADGLAVKTPPRIVFEPWPVPATTRMECTCLEGPKLLEHNGYYYLNVAEGGTAGPATSHSVVSARSRHADGPWEFSPDNPVVHTASRDDRWLSVGHGRLVDTPDGQWYMTVHSYENGYRALGRQLLLLPIEWTADGWFRVPTGITADSDIPMPVAGAANSRSSIRQTTSPALNSACNGASGTSTIRRASPRERSLTLAASGKSLADTSALTTPVGGHSYTVEIDVEVEPGCESGLLLFYNPEHATGILLDAEGIGVRLANGYIPSRHQKGATRATLRVVNDRQEVDFYLRVPGQPGNGSRIRRNLRDASQRSWRLS